MNFEVRSLLEEELGKTDELTGLFSDEHKLSLDYVPEELPFRDKQLREMLHYFKGLFNNPAGTINFHQTVLLVGAAGTGKTATAKRFGLEMENLVLQALPWTNFRYQHVNCRRNRTVFSTLTTLMKSLVPEFPARGFSSAELIRMLQNLLDQTNTYLLLCLDEVEHLGQDKDLNNLLYTLTRMNDEHLVGDGQHLSLILITRQTSFLDTTDDSTLSGLGKNIISFDPYSKAELQLIVTLRMIQALNPTSYDEEVPQLIAALAQESGNARFALELVWKAAKDVMSHSKRYIDANAIKNIQHQILNLDRTMIDDLSFPQKVFLYATCQALERAGEAGYVTLNDVKTQVLIECHERKLSMGTGNTSLWNHVQTLKELQLVATQVVSKNYRGRFTKIFLTLPKKALVQLLLPHLEEPPHPPDT